MANLLSGTHTFDELHQKYRNFLTPAARILLDGNDLQGSLGLAADEVSVDLRMDEASSCTFNIVNAYDLKSSSFNSISKSKVIPGAVVEVSLGYSSNLTLLFKGYISEVSASFRDMPILSVTAMDVRKLMMESGDTFYIHQVKSYSAAFSEVMERYAKLSPNPVLDSTPEEFEDIAQMNNDYDFITKYLAVKADREFFVLAGTAYFRTPEKVTAPILTLEWGRDLISFTRNSIYQDIQVTVIGYDEEKKEAIKGEATEKSDDKQQQVIAQAQKTLSSDPSITDMKAARQAAEKAALERKKRAQGGKGSCIGLPEIVPGRFVKLDKLDSDINKAYYLDQVKHNFGSDGYTIDFEIKGWA